jgi:hypothetical protein
MRPVLSAITAVLAAVTLSTLSSTARAENEFDVNVAKGVITVTAHEGWHINKDFPWKLVMGDTKVDKTKFSLDEKSATLKDPPKGTGKLKGAVCSKDQCHTFEKDVTVQ